MINKSCFIGVLSLLLFSCGGNKHFDNLAKVKKGMRINDVDIIMGTPDSSFVDPADPTQLKYRYNGSFGMSDDMYIYFSLPDSSVKYIYNGS
jgi:hypothetical protein